MLNLFIFFLILISLVSFFPHVKAEESAKPPVNIPSVLVERAQSRSIAPTAEFIGRIEALEKVDFRARINVVFQRIRESVKGLLIRT